MSELLIPFSALSTDQCPSEKPVLQVPVVSLDEDDFQQIWTLEWFWGLSRGALPLNSDLNRLEMRSDMLESLEDIGWTLFPTQETIKSMLEFTIRNYNATLTTNRAVFTEEISGPEHEYEFKAIRLHHPSKRSTIYVQAEDTIRAYHYPYEGLPRIKSRAHPFFVLLKARYLLARGNDPAYWHETDPLMDRVLDIAPFWEQRPPTVFIYGPDIPLEHRYPHSVIGSATSSEKGGKVSGATKTSGKTRASSKTKATSGTKASGKRRHTEVEGQDGSQATSDQRKRRRCGDERQVISGESPSRLSRQALARLSSRNLYASKAEIAIWIHRHTPSNNDDERCDAASIEDEQCDLPGIAAEADAALSHYAQEPSRDPDVVLQAGMNVKRGAFPKSQRPDTSRYCSNDWAERKQNVYLWSDHYVYTAADLARMCPEHVLNPDVPKADPEHPPATSSALKGPRPGVPRRRVRRIEGDRSRSSKASCPLLEGDCERSKAMQDGAAYCGL